MTNQDRRIFQGKAMAVETALSIAAEEGIAAAVQYMYENGISPSTAMRVLSGPEYCRQHRERRKGPRSRGH